MREWSFTRWAHDTPMVKHARTAVRNGFAVVFLRPGGKEPLCPLTARERKKAGPKHPCGVSHASRDERWTVRVGQRLEKEYGHINLGIAAHASGVVVIDADGPEQSETVAELLRQLGEDAAVLAEMPTVQTPGKQRGNEWVHERGTHWYFNRPDELDLPQHPGELVLPGGAVMRWGNSYTLVPPSERAEGPYVSLAEYIPDVPLGLVAMARAHVEAKTQRMVDLGERFANDSIVRWSLDHPWHTLLEPDGWQFTGKLDHQCGCPVWRRPGDDTSTDRSAIAHEDDCTRLPNLEGHGALYIFSDNPPGLLAERVADGQRTFTKLQYVTWARYDGDETAAKVGEGIEPDYASWDPRIPESQTPIEGDPGIQADQDFRVDEEEPVDPSWDPPRKLTIAELEIAPGSPLLGLPDDVRKAVKQSAGTARIRRVGEQWNQFVDSGGVERITKFRASDIPRRAMEATICRRTLDGKFTLYPRRVNSIFGPSDSGKSWFGLYAAVDTAILGLPSMYIDLEDDEDGFAFRLDTIQVPMEVQERIIYRRLWYPPTDIELAEITADSYGPGIVVIDSIDALLGMLGIDTNLNGAVRDAGNTLKRLGRGGAAVLIVDHSTEKNKSGEKATSPLGSSAKKAFVDGVMLRADRMSLWLPGQVCETMIMLGKDRHTQVRAGTEHDGGGGLFGRWAKLVLTPGLTGSDNSEDHVPRLTLDLPPSYSDRPDLGKSDDECAAIDKAFVDTLLDHEWHVRTELLDAAGDKNGRNGLGSMLDKYLKDFANALEVETYEGVAHRPVTRYRLPAPPEEEEQ